MIKPPTSARRLRSPDHQRHKPTGPINTVAKTKRRVRKGRVGYSSSASFTRTKVQPQTVATKTRSNSTVSCLRDASIVYPGSLVTCNGNAPWRRGKQPGILTHRNLPHSRAVSYTHLRAHETKANLVCRLLLEKKKTKQKNKYS